VGTGEGVMPIGVGVGFTVAVGIGVGVIPGGVAVGGVDAVGPGVLFGMTFPDEPPPPPQAASASARMARADGGPNFVILSFSPQDGIGKQSFRKTLSGDVSD
ncbi:MAG: hypothetical protein M3N13_05700, partial [Candidatus Eremiobacteraeota bacterium]|nr:hypothetical protein [Candidatus Eremiobacteraeota bacterium]